MTKSNYVGNFILFTIEESGYWNFCKYQVLRCFYVFKIKENGIGTKVLSDLMMDVKKQGKVVQLSIFYNNEKAKRLYKRLGFQEVSTTGFILE